MAKWIVLILMIAAAVFESLGDLSFRYSALFSKKLWLIVGIVLYVLGTAIWAYTLKFENISSAIVVVNIINLILVALVGAFLFHEQISPVNTLGIFLGITSIVLLKL